MTQSVIQDDTLLSVLHDMLSLYDQRFLDLTPDQRRRLVLGTAQILGPESLSPATRQALPAAYRLRAFCIQRELHDELEQLVRDEVTGQQAGAVVVGGRVYAMYPYLRGVPRHDADITDEVEVEHALDALSWTGSKLRVRGRATISRIQAREFTVELSLRQSGTEHRYPAASTDTGFEALIDPTPLGPGTWEAHIRVHTLGVTREAPYGQLRDPKLKPRTHHNITAHFTPAGTLALTTPETPKKPSKLRRLFHRP